MEKIIINDATNTNKYFLVCFWKIIIKLNVKINIINGILFPDKIIPDIKIITNVGIKNFKILWDIFS